MCDDGEVEPAASTMTLLGGADDGEYGWGEVVNPAEGRR